MSNTGNDILHLITLPSELEATMIADLLRAAGIPVLVQAGGPGFGGWASAATFEHDLFVNADDLARARAVLADEESAGGMAPGAPRARTRLPHVNRRRRRRTSA